LASYTAGIEKKRQQTDYHTHTGKLLSD